MLPARSGVRAGPVGGVLVGALSGGRRASAFVEGALLQSMSTTLNTLAAQRRGVALHVLARKVGPALDVRCGLAETLAVADAVGAPLLVSSSPQSAHDCAVVAHALAGQSRAPVLHAVDLEAEGTTARATLLRYDALANALAQQPASDVALTEASITAALLSVGSAPLLYAGHVEADAVLVVTGGAGAVALSTAAALAADGVRVGVVHMLLLRPFPNAALALALPSTIKRVGCLGAVGPALLPATLAAAPNGASVFAPTPAVLHAPGAPSSATAIASVLRALIDEASRAKTTGAFIRGPVVSSLALPPPRHAVAMWSLSGDATGAAGDASAARTMLRVLAGEAGVGGWGSPASGDDISWSLQHVAGVGALGIASRALLRVGGGAASDGIDVAIVGHPALLSAYDVCAPLRRGGALLLRMPPQQPAAKGTGGADATTASDGELVARTIAALEEHLSPSVRAHLARAGRRILVLPPVSELGAAARFDGVETAALQAAALRAVGVSTAARLGAALLHEQSQATTPATPLATLLRLHVRVREALLDVPIPASWRAEGTVADEDAAVIADESTAEARMLSQNGAPGAPFRTLLPPRPTSVALTRVPTIAAPAAPAPAANAPGPVEFAPQPTPPAPPRRVAIPADVRYAQAAQKVAALSLAFPAAFSLETSPRPHAAGTVEARVKTFRRLTPIEYDRNIFHIEIDIAGTGLVYGIGAALGVHGRNDAGAVREFLAWYGVPANALVQVPVEPSSGHGAPSAHVPSHVSPRVAVQPAAVFFEQEADIFGRATREFYDSLSKWADAPAEAAALRALGSDAGEATFIAREVEGATFADALRDFPSARPPLAELVAQLPRIKPRHYSIASSQRAHPTEVHLLVVEVEWTTPKGRHCFGQCSHYLAGLRAGAPITVSVLTSEMHLPADHAAPVLMAGLGTGMAPFRAFIQERAHLKAAGVPVGPMTLYFGARHRASEYLYGDELEAAAETGLLTLRLAFSRDTAKKVYIQHLMMEDGAMLCAALNPTQGSTAQGAFYLCGPTWPEPDVEEAITSAFIDAGGFTREKASARIILLKAEKNYVLEVY